MIPKDFTYVSAGDDAKVLMQFYASGIANAMHAALDGICGALASDDPQGNLAYQLKRIKDTRDLYDDIANKCGGVVVPDTYVESKGDA